jgi:DHA3 family macrolide efflux protein-like MFS transporter
VKVFVAIWIGQLVTLLGSALTSFALAVFLYQQTGDVGDLALIAAAVYLPYVLVAPYGGVLADRHDRRLLMLGADAGAAAVTAVMLWCASSGTLAPWNATLLVALSASCNALQWPAYESAIVALVPKAQLGRASGLCELSRGASQLLAPLVAGALFGGLGLDGIILLDLASFVVGITPLLLVRIPGHEARPARARGLVRGLREDLGAAWALIARRPGLLAMLALFFVTSFTFAVVELLLKPLVLASATPLELGVVLSAVGVGMVVGSVAMAAWGGPRHKTPWILGFQLVEGGSLIAAGALPSLPSLCVAAFGYGVVIPLTFGCARIIWQVKVPGELQGRVSALRNGIVVLAIPLGYAVASPLASVAGAAPVIVAMGVLTCTAALVAYGFGPYRNIERELDDLLVSSGDACDR